MKYCLPQDPLQQLINQKTDSGQWGLPDQIVHSERGRIPDDPQTLLQRAEDEQVRQALDRGCDRETIAEVFGIVAQTTWHKEKRANAYDFPLEAVSRTGEAGDDTGSESSPLTDTPQETDQQQLEAVTAMDDGDPVADAATSATDGGTPEEAAEPLGSGSSAIQAELTTAIEALQAAKESLSAD